MRWNWWLGRVVNLSHQYTDGSQCPQRKSKKTSGTMEWSKGYGSCVKIIKATQCNMRLASLICVCRFNAKTNNSFVLFQCKFRFSHSVEGTKSRGQWTMCSLFYFEVLSWRVSSMAWRQNGAKHDKTEVCRALIIAPVTFRVFICQSGLHKFGCDAKCYHAFAKPRDLRWQSKI